MNCCKCNTSCFEVVLHRVNPTGEEGVFWCLKCIEENEPELFQNIIKDDKVVFDIEKAINKK